MPIKLPEPSTIQSMPNISKRAFNKLPLNLNNINTQLSLFKQNSTLLAVSKKQTASTIQQAYLLGQRRFGENYAQEALPKIEELRDLNIEWHFIGPIQSNKCRAIAENFHWAQSLDRISIADKLNKLCPANKTLQVCVQVNVDKEANKSGIYIEELENLCMHIHALPRLELRGLMLIPKATKCISEQRQSFAKIKEQFMLLQKKYAQLDTLCMGMSNDYLIALEEGATMIRIGTALFGKRNSSHKA